MSESSPSHLAWPMHPEITPTHIEQRLDQARKPIRNFWIAIGRNHTHIHNDSRPQACRALPHRYRPQAYKCIRPQALPPNTNINAQGRKPSDARRGAQEAASLGGGGEREEGSNPPVHREREGEGAIPTPYMHPIPTFL